MIIQTFKCYDKELQFKIYNSYEEIPASYFPSIVIYSDNNLDYIEPYLFRQILQIDSFEDLNRKTEFIFILQHTLFGNEKIDENLAAINHKLSKCIKITP